MDHYMIHLSFKNYNISFLNSSLKFKNSGSVSSQLVLKLA